MRKKEYLDLLEEVLSQNDVDEQEINVILEDYEELYDGYLERGMTDGEIKEKLGSPFDVVASLKGSMRYKKTYPDKTHEKWIAISPFIALIVFFVLGFMYDLWHPTWLVFFIVPLSGILFSAKSSIWSTLTAISPFIATIFFMLYGYYTGVYHPTWMVFLIIVLFSFMSIKEATKYLYIGFLVIGSLLYLWIGLTYQVYDISLLVFLPLVIVLIIFGDLEVTFHVPKVLKPMGYVVVFTLLIYFLSGYLYGLWNVMWLIFFLVPLTAIYIGEKSKSKYIAMTPFFATTIFFLLGYLFDLWSISWMAFLLIPMVAILIGDDNQKVVSITKKDK